MNKNRKARAFPMPVLLATLVLLALASPWPGRAASAQGSDWPQIVTVFHSGGLDRPVHVTHAGDGSGRLFVVERPGRIRIAGSGAQPPFLDIAARVLSAGSEQGLLSVAFPPGYAGKGYFYVYYTRQPDGALVIARYFLTADPDVADPASEQIVLTVPHPTFGNHNGGQLAFGSNDGLLYAGTGDGGGAGDPGENAQNPASLLGKVLRLDVETGRLSTYTIPASNPFTQTPGYRGEIWALGVRNPWRFSFDRQTGDLFLGDVGQGTWEEIDYQPAASPGGENYGWDILEGNHCFAPATGCVPPPGYVPPVAEYAHGTGDCSVTGGFVYRGTQDPGLLGLYFYGDYCSGRIWGLRRAGSAWETALLRDTALGISTFGEDEAGNLYVTDYFTGTLYRIADAASLVRVWLPVVLKAPVPSSPGF